MNSFQKRFVGDLKRCDEMERKLKFFETQLKINEIEIFNDNSNPLTPPSNEIIEIEVHFLQSKLLIFNIFSIVHPRKIR